MSHATRTITSVDCYPMGNKMTSDFRRKMGKVGHEIIRPLYRGSLLCV